MEIVIQFVVDFCGDLRMCEITAAYLLNVENALPDIPHPAGIPKTHRASFHSRFIYANEQGWGSLRRISRVRLHNGCHRCLRHFFGWARKKSLYVGPDFQFNLIGKKNRAEEKVDAWTEGEILKLFSLRFSPFATRSHMLAVGDRFVQSELYWAYLLIFFMGLRPSEIGRTRLVDFVLIDRRWYVHYRKKS